jgi:hypothetical protein
MRAEEDSRRDGEIGFGSDPVSSVGGNLAVAHVVSLHTPVLEERAIASQPDVRLRM